MLFKEKCQLRLYIDVRTAFRAMSIIHGEAFYKKYFTAKYFTKKVLNTALHVKSRNINSLLSKVTFLEISDNPQEKGGGLAILLKRPTLFSTQMHLLLQSQLWKQLHNVNINNIVLEPSLLTF